MAGMKKLALGENYCTLKSSLPSVHADDDGLTKLNKINKYRRFISSTDWIDIVVLRISKTGVLGNSRPCRDCLLRMSKCSFNIHTVYYSTSQGTIESEKFQYMMNSTKTKFSSGSRHISK